MNRVELNRVLFPYWGDTAVPLFFVIQAFHYYKKDTGIRMPSIPKLLKRILWPFIITICLMFLMQFFIYYDITNGSFSPILYWDKRGPGSYYIPIYLEFAFIIPLFAPLFKRLSIKWTFLIFVILSQLLEFIACISRCPDSIYRVIFFRYTFVIFIGYLLATKGLVINKLSIAAGVIGIFALYLFNYTEIDLEPLFYTSLSNWKYCHWICYLYISYIFLWIIKQSYSYLIPHKGIATYIEEVGKYSYEIYLFQIFYYTIIGPYIDTALSLWGNGIIQRILYIIISTVICVVPVVYIKKKRFFKYN